MLRDLVVFLAGMGVSAILVGLVMFVKMGRENADLKRCLLRIGDGVAHGNAMQQTIHGEELDEKHGEFQRTRQMAARNMRLETDDHIGGDDLGS